MKIKISICIVLFLIAKLSYQCTLPELEIGNTCMTQAEIDECNAHLNQLDGVGDAIDNECETATITYNSNEIAVYNFSITYNDPFYFDSTDCLEQTLFFHFQQLNYGSAVLNEWEFDSFNQEITFTIAHGDLMNLYNCDYYPSDDEYFWQCQVDLNIIFAGETQLTYSFLIQITLSRIYTDELNLTIIKNEVIGDCCENELLIDTTLRYCTDLSCNTYLPDGLVIERLQSFYVEHSIVTQEFQYYYLHFVQIKIGPFIPDMISYDGSQQGRIMYELQSNIALANQVLQSIVRLDENPSRRRFLAGKVSAKEVAEVGDEYRVKATQEVTVVVQIKEDSNQNQEQGKQQDEEEENNNTPLIIIISVLLAVVIFGVIGGVVYCVKMRSKKQNVKLERQDTVELGFAQTDVVVQDTA